MFTKNILLISKTFCIFLIFNNTQHFRHLLDGFDTIYIALCKLYLFL